MRNARTSTAVAAAALCLLATACALPEDAAEPKAVTTTTQGPVTTTTKPLSSTADPAKPVSLTPNAGGLAVIIDPDSSGDTDRDTIVGCDGDAMFPMSALESAPLLAEANRPEIEAAIADFLASGEGAFWPQDTWRILHEQDGQVLIASVERSADGTSFGTMNIEHQDGAWRWAGSSLREDCLLAAALPEGMTRVDWRLDPTYPITPHSTEIHLLVTGRDCNSGRPLGDRLLGPQVIVTDTEILVALAAAPNDDPPGTTHNCQGNPEEPVTITLSATMGDRSVTDGLDLAISIFDLVP